MYLRWSFYICILIIKSMQSIQFFWFQSLDKKPGILGHSTSYFLKIRSFRQSQTSQTNGRQFLSTRQIYLYNLLLMHFTRTIMLELQ